ncbi:MAG TPA: bifunctional riboflavin kinase/FMN adenylyltransferase [Gaiellaceae bacterium]
MKVACEPAELQSAERSVAVGSFDGVHRGHERVLAAVRSAPELVPTVVTFSPHPRAVLGNQVELLSTLERRLELLAAAGIAEALVVEFTPELAAMAPEEFARELLLAIGTCRVAAGPDFRFGRARSGDLGLLERLGFAVERVPPLAGVSSTAIRSLVRAGEVEAAARLLGRPVELEGTVVAGDARGGTLGYPTANLRLEPDLLVPAYGIYAGAAGRYKAAVSVGTNPHYGGRERRVEAFLLDFEGDLYGRRLVLQLWRRLREERAFGSEEELVAQIGRDVAETRRSEPPPREA